MDALWSAPPQPKEGPPLCFPPHLFAFFRQLMRAFDIARPVRHDGSLAGGWYLVPNRLRETPGAAWRDEWRSDPPPVFWRVELRVKNGEPLNHWLGLAIFYRLMIILHGDAQGRQDFTRAAHWRRGFMLAPPGGGLARIEFNGSDRRDATRGVGFDIQVASHQPREIWAVFAEALDHLIHDLEHYYGYTSIVVRRKVSCPAGLCAREAAHRWYIDEAVIAKHAQSGRAGWREQTTICNATDCGTELPLGMLWDGRASEDPGRLGRMEDKLDAIARSEMELHAEVRTTRREVTRSAWGLERLEEDLTRIQHELALHALASEDAVERILNGQARLDQSLRQTMERVSEELSSRLREFHANLAEPASDLPRFYSLMPDNGWSLPLIGKKRWRLWLHCERTGYPAALFRFDRQGEFFIPESQEFLRAVAPYVKKISTVLAALGPLTALLTTASPVIALTPAIVLALAQWAKDYQTPVRRLDALLREETARARQDLRPTGNHPVLAEKEALLWLHNFLRADPANRNKLGLVPKTDGQGRRWWVLPVVEV